MSHPMLYRRMYGDDSVAHRKLPRGIIRRVAGFATPYKRELIMFLLVTVVDAAISVVTPLLAGAVVNQISGHGSVRTVVVLACVGAGLAVVDTIMSLISRCIRHGSARA